uniref:non-specific serine/threonine protein kinase n=1 Tax=Lactuca sativa TaxID=4236 RepID=A0A9R1X608_LACSA|nr:hypothetical protein LSAT_V11C600328670 [Lactuca sativa]
MARIHPKRSFDFRRHTRKKVLKAEQAPLDLISPFIVPLQNKEFKPLKNLVNHGSSPPSSNVHSLDNSKKKLTNFLPLFLALVFIAEISILARFDLIKNPDLVNSWAESFLQFPNSSFSSLSLDLVDDVALADLSTVMVDVSRSVGGESCEEWLEREDSVVYSRDFCKEPVLISGHEEIKREISIMKIVRHPNIVRLHEVLSSHTKIYIILEFVIGGELFDRINCKPGDTFNSLMMQLPIAIPRPENLFLDSKERLKVSNFGLSALLQEGVELLYTPGGTPNYITPKVLRKRGYDGGAADIWSCGVIMYVLLTGYLPFEESDLPTLYKKVSAAEFSYPFWFPSGAKSLLDKIMDPNPQTVSIYNNIFYDLDF